MRLPTSQTTLHIISALLLSICQLASGYSVGNVTVSDGVTVFYREAGDPTATTVLLLHGFPSSSHQYRNLIPILAKNYHVIAPDYPAFGFTQGPPSSNFTYTFDTLADVVGQFLDAKNITTFVPYLFDYGAPIGMRLALRRPNDILALISQNGNLYIEGFGQDFWAPIFATWNASTPADLEAAYQPLNNTVLTFSGLQSQYTIGTTEPWKIEPESYWLDYALIEERPGNKDIQLGLFRDYRNNVALYPRFQAWLRQYQPETLVAWGKNDIAFIPPGAKAFRRDVPAEKLEVHFLDAGHFLLESNLGEMAGYVLGFLERVLPSGRSDGK